MTRLSALATAFGIRRALLVQVFVTLCVVGVAGSIYFVYDRFARYYSTRENLVWVSTQAEVELARYSNSLLRVVGTRGTSPEALSDAEFRFDIFLSRIDLYRSGSVHDALVMHQDGRALLARIETIEPTIDPRSMTGWSPEDIQRLERRIAAAAMILREASLILLRREAQDERDLLALFDASAAVSVAFFLVGAITLVFFLRARGQALRNAQLARIAAEEANRAKGDFLATMSHEIRTPLNAVIGLSNLLDNTELNAQQRHFVQTMEAAGGQLLQIVNDVLDFSRLQAGRVELAPCPLHVRSFVDRLVLIVNGLPNAARLEIVERIAPDVPPRILADDGRLMQILTNLMGNAVKFTSAGRVSLDVVVDAPGGAEPKLRFVVTDTGPGVPDALRAEIFEPFKQGRAERLRPHAGSGLGLSISRSLARLMGGDVVLMPSTGRGASFVVTMPLRIAQDDQRGEAVQSVERTAGPLDILVAEDTPTNQLVVRLMLEGLGHRVKLADNGLEAVDSFAAGRFDLVFLDIQMPVMDGFEAARRIRAAGGRGGDVPILALSAFTQASDREQAAASGITEFLSKPIRQREIATAIARFVPTAEPAAAR